MDILWLLASFVFGGLCGMLVMAMLQINRYEPPPYLDPRGVSPLERVTQ